MYVTLNDATHTVQVSMAGQSYTEDSLSDGPLLWWRTKGADRVIIVNRLNRADGTITIINSAQRGMIAKGNCIRTRLKF
jgi:hypothetical protein